MKAVVCRTGELLQALTACYDCYWRRPKSVGLAIHFLAVSARWTLLRDGLPHHRLIDIDGGPTVGEECGEVDTDGLLGDAAEIPEVRRVGHDGLLVPADPAGSRRSDLDELDRSGELRLARCVHGGHLIHLDDHHVVHVSGRFAILELDDDDAVHDGKYLDSDVFTDAICRLPVSYRRMPGRKGGLGRRKGGLGSGSDDWSTLPEAAEALSASPSVR
jgi:hypothetical protein